MKHCDLVIPLYNEAASLEELHRQIVVVMSGLPVTYTVIFVDDGSTDRTMEILEHLADADQHVKIVSFTRNFGHQIALTAGLEHSSGDCVITMDGDLQHPPQLIPELLRVWEEGRYEVVSTVWEDHDSVPLLKTVSARAFYKLINLFSDITLTPGSADFRLLDRQVVSVLMQFREKNKFLRGLVNWIGFKSTSVAYRCQKRFGGHPKYSFSRMVKFAWDGITAFSAFPLRLAFCSGFLISLCSFSYGVFAIVAKVVGVMTVPGWTSILVSVLFLGGLQLMFIGMLGEYIARIFDEVKDRPLYVVKKTKL